VSGLISTGAALTEIDVAHAVEREALSRGAEGLGFETLSAGPRRSWGIHPFPVSSAGPFATAGFSILDFGISVDGYTSDVTITVAAGRLSGAQEQMLGLVQRAYDQAVAACRAGQSPQAPARAAEAVFSSEGWSMPHALGHGIGLDAHEGPLIRSLGEPSDPELAPGMAFTIEPGLYHPEHGGVRLENDVLMTEAGPTLLTESRILRI
jgi:Xaa-Pro dipeptidase